MIEAAALKSKSVRHGFFTRQGGHSQGLFAALNCGMGSGDDKAVVWRNRSIVAKALNVSEPNLITAYQVHGCDAVTVTEAWREEQRPRADAIVTAASGIAIGILTADCAPILFSDAEAGVIGVAHAGWKGALANVAASTLVAMERLGAKRSHTVAAIGPTISRSAYEVGPEFADRFLDADKNNAAFFGKSPRANHAMFDLPGFLAQQLEREGVEEVANLGLCTFSDEERFFSYRRTTHRDEKEYGRQISAIALT